MQLLEIIIPVYNEAGNLNRLLQRLKSAFSSHNLNFKAIFIDDHSTDNSLKILSNLARKYPLEVHSKIGQKGKAYSIIEGVSYCKRDVIAMLDGDLQYPPESLPEMLVKLTSEVGVVVAHRRSRETSVFRSLFSKLGHQVFNIGLHNLPFDIQSGLKVFRKEIVSHISADSISPWALDLPLLLTARNLGYKICEVDINFSERQSGQSKLSFFKAGWQIASTSLKHKFIPAKIYPIVSTHYSNMLGAGIIHKGKKFITHTHLEKHHSAVETLIGWQKLFLFDLFLLVLLLLVLAPVTALTIFIAFLSTIYFLDVLFNFYLVSKSLQFPPEIKTDLKKITDYPVYSILCPLYKESKVLPQFVANIDKLDWPKDKLDVLLLLEENDTETIEAARKLYLPKYFRLIIVPHSFPKTKPKACNYGLIFAKGDYTVIYDAEDRPEPDQLKKAYLAFQKSSEKIVCLQAKLNYYNPSQNLLTRLFTAEYSLWFDVTLPGLQTLNTALPLGGTSNHFRTSALRDLRGWDAFNVTEDCDLGARLFKLGYRTAMIDSTTWEEANSNLGNWIRQRSRWIKGYLQTYFVHNRQPLKFFRQQGIHALYFQFIVGGKIAFMIINPVLWIMTLAYFTAYQIVGPTIESLYPTNIFYLAAFSAVFGNFMFFYFYMLGLAKRGLWQHVKYAFLIPIYWVFISFAALKAFIQLIYKPHYWEKTNHGLHLSKTKNFIFENLYFKNFKLISNLKFKISNLIPQIMISGGILVFANALVSVLNFLYSAFLSRHLSLEDFGLIALFTGLISIINVPFAAFSKTIVYRSAYLKGKLNTVASEFWSYIRSRIWPISILLTFLWLIITPSLGHLFKSSPIPYLLFSPVLLFGLASSTDGAFLSGSFKFKFTALLMVFETLVKFILAYIFVTINRPDLVYSALPISFLLVFIATWQLAKHTAGLVSKTLDFKLHYFPTKFFATGILVKISYIASLGLDIVLAKILLSPADAGRFALVSTMGKMIYFLGSQVTQFIVPAVSLAEGEGGANSKKTFYQLLLTSFAVSGAGWLFFGLFGYITAPILLGSKVNQVLIYLPYYGLAMVAFTIANSIINFHHLRRQYVFPIASVFLAGLEILGFYFYHQNLDIFIRVILAFSLIYLFVILSMHLFYKQIREIFLLIKTKGNGNFVPSGKLKILIFNWRDTKHIWGGGAEVYLQELAKRWVAEGHKVTIFCGNDHKSQTEEFIDGVRIIRRGGFFTVYIWAFLYYIFKFRGHYDVVIDSENGVPFFTPLYVKEPKFLLIHHVHQNVFRQHLKFPLCNIAMFMESTVMPFVYRHQPIITVSKSSQKDILALGLGKKTSVSIVNPGVDLKQFNPGAKTVNPSFLYLGRIRPYKNIDVAIKAFSQVHETYPKAIFHIAGWGENIKQLRHLVSALNLTTAIKFHERVSDEEKSKLLRSSWVMLQPSSFEGWGITVIEAAASGTPTIASNVIGLRDSVIDQQTGILVPVKHASALADAMINLIKNPIKLKKLSQNSLTWAKEFDWDKKSLEFNSVISPSTETAPVIKRRYRFRYVPRYE